MNVEPTRENMNKMSKDYQSLLMETSKSEDEIMEVFVAPNRIQDDPPEDMEIKNQSKDSGYIVHLDLPK